MSGRTMVVAGLVLSLGLAARAPAQPTAEQVDAAIARGVAYLWSQQRDNGTFPGYSSYPGGNDVMAMVALAYAGESLNKPEMEKALKALAEMDLEKTYTLGFRIIALAELYRRADAKVKPGLRALMKQDAERLVDYQLDNAAWDYTKRTGVTSWDFSNTQIAILGLQQAVLSGVEIRPEVFIRAQQLYLEKQREDGGWNYGRPGQWERNASYGSMTAAAVASLFITRDLLDPGMGCPCQGERSSGVRNPKVEEAIKRGVKWLGDSFAAGKNPGRTTGNSLNPYWLYAVERVGIATGFKYLGTHNWYAEGASALLRAQQANGSIGRTIPDTSFALLFLVKGRGPILMNKVQFDGEWDRHPHDAENLAKYVGQVKEQPILWQVIHLDVPVEEMHDAPILYFSAESTIPLSDQHKKKLRDFTDSGGTILFEASCGNRAVDVWWKKTCAEIWPEWELKLVDKDHPLWLADVKMMGRLPLLLGMSDGVRTFLFYAPRDLSCAWNTMGVTRNKLVFDLGSNLYAYTTDRGKLRAKLAKREVGSGKKYAGQTLARGPKDSLTLARVKHGGDWYVGQNYHPWELLGAEIREKTGLDVKEIEAVAPGDPIPAGTAMLYLSCRGSCDLGDAGLKWLRDYVAAGGFLFAEAVMGDRRADEAIKAALAAAGLKLTALDGTHSVLSGQFGGARGYSIGRVGYTFALRGERIGHPTPLLLGIYQGDALVGVYSPFDILYRQTGCAAWDCRGYDSDDARALAMNIVLQATTRDVIAAQKPAE